MAALERSTLIREVNAIISQQPNNVHYTYRAEILANEKTVHPLKVLSVDVVRDYASAYSDEVFIELVLPSGTYAHMVHPYREDLVITLFKEPVGQTTTEIDLGRDIDSQPMRAVIVNDSSSVLEGDTTVEQSQRNADLTSIKTVKFQLVDLAVEQIRAMSCGGLLRNTTPGEALRYMLTELSRRVDVDDEHQITGVDLYPPSNTTPQKQIVLSHGLKFSQLADFLHEQAGGIYNAGIGYYLQQHTWYVYPLYDLKRYENSLKGLTLINIPKNRLPGVEVSYRRTANQVIALVTGDVVHQDDSERLMLNRGNGVRFTDSTMLFEAFAETEDNRAKVQRATNNHEYITKQRKNELNNVHLASERITGNVYAQSSRMARRAGAHLQCVWENSQPTLVFPGMPVKYMYTVRDKVMETFGIVIGAHHVIKVVGTGMMSRRYTTSTILTLFVDRELEWEDLEKQT